ncbi:hypothetical protein [Actinomycetospora aeridis]|uniref:MerR-like DNA binding protein n=1 Tax=Actinomycetospora aeridis TaxID=3129231 RepID=A0ABU8N368_9PSEU
MSALPPLPHGVDVFHQAPSPQLLDAVCGACATERCHPVATVGWVDALSGQWTETVVGAACLADEVTAADERRAEGSQPVAVDVPAWTIHDLARDAGITPATALTWWRLGYLTEAQTPIGARESLTPQRFLADEVRHARALWELHQVGLTDPAAAHLLLSGTDADRAVAAALVSALARETAVAS